MRQKRLKVNQLCGSARRGGIRKDLKRGESLPLLPAFVAVRSFEKSVGTNGKLAREYRLHDDDAKEISKKRFLDHPRPKGSEYLTYGLLTPR
jgi:hypothetical protein